MKALKMVHKTDPKQVLLSALGDISNYRIFNNQVLLAIYERPEMTAGGVLLTARTRKEDEFQGKVGLIVAMGPAAFQPSPETGHFKTGGPGMHDWVAIRASDGWAFKLGETMCRLIADHNVRMQIPAPDLII